MTKKELVAWMRENNIDEKRAVGFVEEVIYQYGTNWSTLEVSTHHGATTNVSYTHCGYRKNTTGEYVSNAYRNNFGWKNTYYQRAILSVSFGESGPYAAL